MMFSRQGAHGANGSSSYTTGGSGNDATDGQSGRHIDLTLQIQDSQILGTTSDG